MVNKRTICSKLLPTESISGSLATYVHGLPSVWTSRHT